MLKPVYLRNSDIVQGSNPVTDYELLESVLICTSEIKCIQRDRGLWRIYVNTTQSRDKLLTEGFDFRNTHINVFETNPFSAGTNSPLEEVLRITIKGVPLSVDDGEIIKMLDSYKVSLTSPIKYENIRHPTTHKMTSILNGNRFVYAKPLQNGQSLPRSAFCAGIKCLIYHKGQPSKKRVPKCTNCWGEHWRTQCSDKKRCRICLKTDHEPGSEKCEAFVENQKNVISFAGADNPLSNFFPCTIHVFGIHHRSAEHAFQYVKAIRCGDLSKATAIQAAETALDAKMISKTIQINDEFIDKQEKLMEEIVNAKYDQVEAFREILDKQEQSTLFAESVYDDFWGTGLNKAGTEHTDHRKWPGQNVLGQIFRKIVSTRRPAPPRRSESVPRNLQAASQRHISDMLSSIRKSDKRADKQPSTMQDHSRSPRKSMRTNRRKNAGYKNTDVNSLGEKPLGTDYDSG